MRAVKIAVLNLNDTRRDPRVRRVAETMSCEGYKVTVFDLGQADRARREPLDSYEVVRVLAPGSCTREDMQAIERLCSEAGTILRTCTPEVMGSLASLLTFDGKALLKSRVKQLSPWLADRMKTVRHRLSPVLDWHRLWQAAHRRIFQRNLPDTLPAAIRPAGFDISSEISAIRYLMLINLEMYKQVQEFEPDIVYCNDLDTLLAGVLCKIKHRTVLLFDAHEIYPEQFAEHMRSDIWYKFYSRLERHLLPFTDGRLTVCDSLGDYFQRVYASEQFLTLRNTPSIKYLPDESILQRRDHPVKILYHGNYFQYRGLDEIIAIAHRLDNALFVFRGIGEYESTLKAQVSAQQLDHRVQFMPPVSVHELISTASVCDIGLNPFVSVCLNTAYALPNKFFEYMMAGLAVVSSDLIEMRLLTQKLDNGVLFNAGDPESIVASLQSLVCDRERLQYYRSRSYEAAKTEFHWENEAQKLKEYLRQFV